MGLELTPVERRWISHIKENVVPLLGARTTALVTWWSLKEGVLDLPNPWRHNLCSRDGRDVILSDLDVCPGAVWQVGMSGIQPKNVSLAQVEAATSKLYPDTFPTNLLRRIAQDAGVDASTADAIERSTGELRKAWLLRDPAIGFFIQAPFVEQGCIQKSHTWCYGGWDTAKRFASSTARVREVVSSLEAYFAGTETTAFSQMIALFAFMGAGTWWLTRKRGR